MLIGGIVPDEQDRGSLRQIARARQRERYTCRIRQDRERSHQGGEIRRAVMIDVIGSQHRAGKLLQQIIFFVGGVIGTNHAETGSAGALLLCEQFFPARCHGANRLIPI